MLTENEIRNLLNEKLTRHYEIQIEADDVQKYPDITTPDFDKLRKAAAIIHAEIGMLKLILGE